MSAWNGQGGREIDPIDERFLELKIWQWYVLITVEVKEGGNQPTFISEGHEKGKKIYSPPQTKWRLTLVYESRVARIVGGSRLLNLQGTGFVGMLGMMGGKREEGPRP